MSGASSQRLAAKLSNADYLKKYLGGPSTDTDSAGAAGAAKKKVKKKKKVSEGVSVAGVGVKKIQGLKIVDAEEAMHVDRLFEDEEDPDAKPIIIIDPDEVKKAQPIKTPYVKIEDGSGWVTVSDPSLVKTEPGEDSPPRRQQAEADASPPRRQAEDSSPPRQRAGVDSSPPRRRQGGADSSPPRRRQGGADSSPPRRRQSGADSSPPRRVQVKVENLDDDSSPPRRRQSGADLSPPRRRQSGADLSPPRNRRGGRTDSSPPRNRPRDSSPRNRSRDSSPPRNRSRDSSPRNRRRRDVDSSPRNKSREDSSPPRKRTKEDDSSPPRRPAGGKEVAPPTRMSSGALAGLHDAASVKRQADEVAKQKTALFDQADTAAMGKDAETVYRDRKGRKLEGLEAFHRQMKGQYTAEDEENMEWGKGKVQHQQKVDKKKELEEEALKPFARRADDKDMNDMLKEVDRWGDPMLGMIKKKPKKSGKDKPTYTGPPGPPNRFNINPGFRWDGVDRSNGFEIQLFALQSKRIALKDEAYLWSVEDM